MSTYIKICLSARQECCERTPGVPLPEPFTGNYIRDLKSVTLRKARGRDHRSGGLIQPCLTPTEPGSGRALIFTADWVYCISGCIELFGFRVQLHQRRFPQFFFCSVLFRSIAYWTCFLLKKKEGIFGKQLTTHWTVAWESRSVRCGIRHSWRSCWTGAVYAPLEGEKHASQTDGSGKVFTITCRPQPGGFSLKRDTTANKVDLSALSRLIKSVVFPTVCELLDLSVDLCSPSSIQVIPSDQMSTFPSYWPSSMARITSGAILRTQRHTHTVY